MKKFLLICHLIVAAHSAGQGKKISLENIDDYSATNRASNTLQTKPNNQVSSPTKFGFVPTRTAESYAATQPKQTFFQDSIRVKQPGSNYQLQQYKLPNKYAANIDYSQDYSNVQQHAPQQPQQYPYLQPDLGFQQYQKPAPQQYEQTSQVYQQPAQHYQQYENVHYLTENSLSQSDNQQYYPQVPQYYYVQQYQAPTTAVETVVDPKAGVQYVMYLPASSEYSPNAIQNDQKYQDVYSDYHQIPAISVKYTVANPKKYTTISSSQKHIQPSKVRNQKQQEYIIKREPKSLLDSYIPSAVQLRYLEQSRQNKKYN
ncbi:uncharacterized protein LOC132705051 [Cylas formicarius]|uniref:uncharacterized protein LOC132705051 n=1 Tax=Cylas formicarius TaxID=197179 RepID=UPI002958D9A3|nr:uncharacterized protein LOC132705051 [Cylas formicarius]